MIRFGCHFQDIFSEIIPHSGNCWLWKKFLSQFGVPTLSANRFYSLCRVANTCIFLIFLWYFTFGRECQHQSIALRNPQIRIKTSKLTWTTSCLHQFTLARPHSSSMTLQFLWWYNLNASFFKQGRLKINIAHYHSITATIIALCHLKVCG